MSVRHLHHFALTAPDPEMQKTFYEDFGLAGAVSGNGAIMRCKGRDQDQIIVVEGAERRLHHISFGTDAEGLEEVEKNAEAHPEATLVDCPNDTPHDGIWIRHSMDDALYNVHISEPAPSLGGIEPTEPQAAYKTNTPGHFERVNAPVDLSMDTEVWPRRLGHVLNFATDVDHKLSFYENVMGLRLSDRSGDFVLFMRTPGGSDHHVLALVKDEKPGFHHASFEVGNADEVGIAGQRLIQKGYRDGWGFGRHKLGSNFFWYIRDPHNGLCEYFSDIDYIADDNAWEAQDWPPEVSFYLWGPNPPESFGINYEGTDKPVKPAPVDGPRT